MLSIPRISRISTAALVAAVLCVLLATSAGAQTPTGDIQSVGVSPTESKPDDPNAGQWFVFSIAPGESGTTKARITNPADEPQEVKMYLTDLVFGPDGTPSIPTGNFEDVGNWGRFEQASITVPARGQVLVPFTVNVPTNAEPGDHVGAMVVESQPRGDTLKIVKRIATRLYVTVPGDATKSYAVVRIAKKVSSTWFPKTVAVTTLLRNSGRVRIHPVVSVAGTKATGADPLLARSVEAYTATVKIPWYGGPVKIPVAITSDAGNKQLDTSLFVIPYGNIAALCLGVLLVLAFRRLWRLRGRKVRGLQADLKRLEKMVAERPMGTDAARAALAEHGSGDGHDDPEAERIRSIRAGIKRARRNHAQEPLERLSLSLHDTGEDALSDLLAALEHAEGAPREALVAAAASYGADRLATVADVPDDVLGLLAATVAAPAVRKTSRATAKSATPKNNGSNGQAVPRTRRRPSAAADRAGSDAGTASDSARVSKSPRTADAGAAPTPRKKQPAGVGRDGPSA